ncbi:terminase small subunit [Azospirillum argentinense]|uniref:Terminase small subunit (DNA packaging protein Nu1) n=1 Tax=Azospirillum brasilense TaxID=192 RepID=A0A4D8Q677_AZOBR|nr:terminase small subunit [Azospirillum argentinense]QCO03039.1 Terminase small subunit (DNA packaging protein Nu1) [Azospirillum argentinense]
MAGRTYSLSEAATILGRDRNTVSKWLGQGCPAVTKADRARGVEWSLSIPDIVGWLIDRAVGDAVQTADGEADRITKEEADRRKAVAQAIAEEVSTAELLDDVVNRHEAAADAAAFAVALRTGMANVCGKVAGRAATMTSAAEIQEFLEAETNKAFSAAQEELAERWADAEPAGSGGDGEDRPPPGG